MQKVPLQRNITHPHKRLQHLAARWLLQDLFPDFPYREILVADTRKPYLASEKYHFSVSHTGDFAAAIVSNQQRVGLDIERVSLKIGAIAHKFLHETDVKYMHSANLHGFSNDDLLAFMWAAKESLYKWHSLGGVDFKQHLQLAGQIIQIGGARISMPFVFKKDNNLNVTVSAQLFTGVGLVMAWCAT